MSQELKEAKVAACLAAAEAAEAEGELAEAISQLSAAIFVRPADPRLYARRAELAASLCDFSTVVANLRRAHALSGGADAEFAARLAHALNARALTLIDDGEHAAALTCLDEALELAAQQAARAPARHEHAARVGGRRAEAAAVDAARGANEASPAAVPDAAAAALASLGAHATGAFRTHRALAHVGLGAPRAAIGELEALAAGEGASADAFFLLARLQLKSGELLSSRQSLQAALELEPAHRQARVLRALMARSAQVFDDEATRLLLVGYSAEAVSNLTAAIALDPTNPQLLRRRALAHKQAAQPQLAARDLTAAIDLSGGAYPEAARALTAVHNDAAIAEVAEGRLGAAVESLSLAIAREPTVARYRANRAEVAHRLGDAQLALEDYSAARALAEAAGDERLEREMRAKMSVLHYQAGTLLFNRAEYAAAYAALSRAVQANPRVPAYLLARAEVATVLKQWDVVRADAEVALAIDPSDGRARQVLSRVVPAA